LTDEQWDQTFKTNIYGYFRPANAALPHRQSGAAVRSDHRAGAEQRTARSRGDQGAFHPCTKSPAQNLVAKGIRVNCVAPGPVWTPLNPPDKVPAAAAMSAGSRP
jgi:NAD(P)-dependent dehydrogenase (short-subunit alcohol dehydrogenase family)